MAAPAIDIRSYASTDYDAVRDLFVEGMLHYPIHLDDDGRLNPFLRHSLKTDLADIEGTYLNAGGHFWVATTEDPETKATILVGTIGLERKSDSEGELRRMSVKASHRRYGLGRLLVSRLELWAREQQLKSVVLSTRADMTDACAFYPKVGFAKTGQEIVGVGPRAVELAHFAKQL